MSKPFTFKIKNTDTGKRHESIALPKEVRKTLANAIKKNIGSGVGYATTQDPSRAIRFVETKPKRWRVQIRVNGKVVVESEPLFQDDLIAMLLQDTAEALESVA